MMQSNDGFSWSGRRGNATLSGVRWLCALLLVGALPVSGAPLSPPQALDCWLDERWDHTPVEPLLQVLQSAHLDCVAVERLLRAGRAAYPDSDLPRGKLIAGLKLPCDHVDHATEYMLYLPQSYDSKRATPLVVVVHGGSAGRDLAFGRQAAVGGLTPFWLQAADRHGFIIVAPITDRGWNTIGNSILFSAISKVVRDYHIDPDRIYVTGHSMGGHCSWRCGINLPDRWGAVSPMSGGYDYVKDQSVYNLFNVPGFATYGTHEPYQINQFNHRVQDWMRAHHYPWENHENPGGHEIFPNEIEPISQFFANHPRNLYRPQVVARGSGRMVWETAEKNPQWPHAETWIPGRGIPLQTFHWVRLVPLPADLPPARALQQVWAVNRGGNTLDLTTTNVRHLILYLHPKLVDFGKNVVVTANGKKVWDRRVEPDLKTLLELVREFDDRGRVFYAKIEVNIDNDQAVPEPMARE